MRAETIARVADALQHAAAVVPTCNGQRGHPVGFAATHRDELVALRGATGARRVLARDPDTVMWLEVDDPGICRDLDRHEELAGIGRALR